MTAYTTEDLIHEGRNTLVFRGTRVEDGARVVIKQLRALYPGPDEVAASRREFDILQIAASPGVVRAIDHTHQDGRVWLVLEDFGGRSLADLYRHRRPSIPEAIDLCIRIVEALADVHARDVVHKSLSPATVLVNPTTQTVKLVDFSIASTVARERTVARSDPTTFANLLYMAPEQSGRMNRVVDYRSDYYALGALLYELITGRPPFVSGDPLDLIHAHTARQPTPPASLRPEIPGPLSSLVMTLLAKRAEHRYQSAAGLLHDLAQCRRLATGESDAPFATRSQDIEPRFRIPEVLYGRHVETAVLESACNRVAEGAVTMLLVAGEPGIGKTTLVQEVHRPATQMGAHVITGKFDQVNRGLPYASLVQAFRQFIRHILAGSSEDMEAWGERLNAAVGASGRVLTNLIGELELIMGEQPPLDDVSPIESQNRLRITFQRFVRAMASEQAPLILFLDDLQWADLASLRLLEAIALDPEAAHILLLGAYRDNEVDPSGPLLRIIEIIAQERNNVDVLTLGPLQARDVRALLADALRATAGAVEPLAAGVIQKTRGNPFYMARFLEGLYTDGLLRFEDGRWVWDMPEIDRRSVTENVVSFLSRELDRLPPETQRALHLAACVGVRFGLHMVAELTDRSRRETQADLQRAVQRDLIHPLDESYWPGDDASEVPDFHFVFAHDRVQQAAHEALDEKARNHAHLGIGRLMRDRMGALQRSRRLFEMVEHFNHAADDLSSTEERDQLASLNLQAGLRALESAAYGSAHRYLSHGIALTDEDSWTRHYAQTLDLYVAAAEAAYLAGDDDTMAARVAAVTDHATDKLDRMRAEEIVVYGLIRRNQLLEAVHKALDLLDELGIKLPRDPSQDDLAAKVGEVIGQLSGYDEADLLRLPELNDPEIEAARKLMNGVASAAYLTVPTLFPLIAIELVQNTLQRGISKESAYGFALVGLVFASVKQIPLAAAQARVCVALLDRWDDRALRVRPAHVLNSMIAPWTGPIRDTWTPLLRNYADGVDTGDLEYGFWSAHQYCYHVYYGGLPLDRADAEINGIMRAMNHHKQLPHLAVTAPFGQLVANLRGAAEDPSRLIAPGFHEDEVIQAHKDSQYRGAVFVVSTVMLMARVLFRDWEGASAISPMAREYSDSAPATIHCSSIIYYGALALLGAPDPGPDAVAQAQEDRDALAVWAEHNPHNYQPWVDLLDAEIARVERRVGDATVAFDAAIAGSRASGMLAEEALANERAGLFHLERGSTTAGRAYLVEARYAYQRWGAVAKVRHLTEAHPELDLGAPSHAAAGVVDVDQLSLVRASHALASEIRLRPLVRRVIELGIQAAGATRGFLLTERDGAWVIEVGLDADGREIVDADTPMTECRELATTVVQYVGRTQEQLVLADASEDRRFTLDPWLDQAGPTSMLCTPVAHKGQTRGILYLENHLVSGCFTPDRLENAQVLASQAAISMENAALVDTLESKVAARTGELRDALAHTRAIVDHMAEGLVAIDARGRVEAANPAVVDILGAQVPVGGLAPNVLPSALAELVQTSARTGEVRQIEIDLPGERTGAAIASPIRALRDDENTGAVVLVRDITLLKEIDRMKSEFTSTVAHELRTPMTSVVGFVKLTTRTFDKRLRDQLPDDPRTQKAAAQVTENLAIVTEEAERLTALISNMLDLAKIESGRMEWQKSDQDPAGLVERASHACAGLFANRSIAFEQRVDGDLPAVHGDPDWLQQVLVNLVSNAAKFTDEGTVTIGATRAGDHVRFTVTDTGTGLSEEDRVRVFEKFAQAKTGGDRKGTGLGLPICKEIVAAHHGEIGCDSALGEGATFWFHLPAAG